jgi:hypothetical protein
MDAHQAKQAVQQKKKQTNNQVLNGISKMRDMNLTERNIIQSRIATKNDVNGVEI